MLQATNDVAELHLDESPRGGPASCTSPTTRSGELDGLGRRIFYNATNRVTSGGVACAGCHPEGRDDGHVWHEKTITTRTGRAGTNFLGDPDEAPAREDPCRGLPAADADARGARRGGRALRLARARAPISSRASRRASGCTGGARSTRRTATADLLGRAQHLTPFLRHGLVPPPRDVRPETPEEARGRAIFLSERARCSHCHVPETEYTDRIAYPLDAPAAAPAGLRGREGQPAYKTPSLRFVGGTPPYFHDGRAPTLEALIDGNDDRMGHTNQLSREDRAALARLPEDAMNRLRLLPLVILAALAPRASAAGPSPDAGAGLQPPRFDAEPFGDDATPAPKAAEWKPTTPVSLTSSSVKTCRAYRLREWVKIRCSEMSAASLALLGGIARGRLPLHRSSPVRRAGSRPAGR